LGLLANGGSWHEIPKKISVSTNLGKQIKKQVIDLYEHPSLASGFKDPRILPCLESWLKYIPKNFIIIGIFRDPLKVAESLKQRNQFEYEKSLTLWKIYNEKLLEYLKKYNGFLLNFDWSKNKLLSEIQLILGKLGLDDQVDLTKWYTAELFHSDKTFQSKHHIPKDVKLVLSSLEKKAAMNKKNQN